jgi:hypothetical protein
LKQSGQAVAPYQPFPIRTTGTVSYNHNIGGGGRVDINVHNGNISAYGSGPGDFSCGYSTVQTTTDYAYVPGYQGPSHFNPNQSYPSQRSFIQQSPQLYLGYPQQGMPVNVYQTYGEGQTFQQQQMLPFGPPPAYESPRAHRDVAGGIIQTHLIIPPHTTKHLKLYGAK